MSSMGDYLRKQAATCTMWSRECFDLEAARRLRLMAEELRQKAGQIDADSTKDDDEPDFDYSRQRKNPSSLQA